MTKFIIKRVLWVIPVMLGVLFIVFTISYLTPGDPVMAMLGTNFTQEVYDAKVIELGLNRPFIVQYLDYVWQFVSKGSLGTSYTYGHSVSAEIMTRLWTTLRMGLASVALTTVIGVPLGILSATRQYTPLDYGTTIVCLFLAAMPNFWLALMLIIIFALRLNWFPVSGMGTLRHWVLPVVANSMPVLANVARMSRTSMLDVIHMDYIRTARAKGVPERSVIFGHALRNALLPIITVVGMQVGFIMAGSVIVESIFNIPGLGAYLLAGIKNRDYPVINACVLVLSLFICLANLVVDILYAYIDPRIMAQYGASRRQRKTQEAIAAAQAAADEAAAAAAAGGAPPDSGSGSDS